MVLSPKYLAWSSLAEVEPALESSCCCLPTELLVAAVIPDVGRSVDAHDADNAVAFENDVDAAFFLLVCKIRRFRIYVISICPTSVYFTVLLRF